MKILAILLLASSLYSEPGFREETPEAKSTILDLSLVNAMLSAHVELTGDDLESPDKPITLRKYTRGFDPGIRNRLVFHDAWANEFIVMGVDYSIFVVSAGPDQVDQTRDLLKLDPTTERAAEDALGDDIVLIVGEGILNGPASLQQRQRRSMADLRSIGTAIESFSIDNDVYPTQDRDLLPIDTIADKLTPIYIRTLPRLDGWGNEYVMWGTENEYVIISFGADGLSDRYYDFLAYEAEEFPFRGATTDPDDDIIFANGQFVQWPEGNQN